MKRGWKAIGNIISQKCKDTANVVTNTVSGWDEAFDKSLAKAEKKICKPVEVTEGITLDSLVESIVKENNRPQVPSTPKN